MHAKSNEVAELTIIGKIIRGEAIASEIQKQGITREHFIHYRLLYVAVVEFAASDEGTEIDFITRLTTLGKLDAVGGAANITRAAFDSIGAQLPLAIHALKTAYGANMIQSAARVLATDPNNSEALEQIEAGRKELAGIDRSQSKRLPLVGGVNGFPTDPPPFSILVGNGAIRLGDIAFLNSGAGHGKSVCMGQIAMAWALGLPYFGIEPSRPLRILHYVGEDDEATMGQIREGFLQHSLAITGQQLTAQDLEPLDEMLMTQFDRTAIGNFFLAESKKEIEAFRPDMVFINPLLSYIGGDPVQSATQFLRVGLMPVLAMNKCAALIAHHTCKLTKESWTTMDPTYSGIGGGEMANIPRVVLTLMPVRDGIIRLQASKRTTFGWKDANDKYMDHAFFRRTDDPTRPAWLPVPYTEVEALVEFAENKRRKGDLNDVLEILKNGDRLKSEVIKDLMKKIPCTEGTARERVKEALAADIGVREYDGVKPERGGSAPKWLSKPPIE